jgi:MFS family permease
MIYNVGATAGFQGLFVLGVLSAQKLNGTDLVLGVSPVTLLAIGQIVVSPIAGRWMDRWGRKRVLVAAGGVESLGLFAMGGSILLSWSWVFVAGLLLLGLGSGAAVLVYMVGGDLYPPHRRGEGLSLMSTFTSIGAIAGTYMVGLVGDVAAHFGLDSVASPWFFAGAVVAGVSLILSRMGVEPNDVLLQPERYFDDVPAASLSEGGAAGRASRGLGQLLTVYPIAASVGITICLQGVRMSIVPLLTSILRAQGYSLTLGATMVAAMGFGTVVAGYPVGRLGDQWGRRRPLILALVVALVCTIGVFSGYSLVIMFGSLFFMGCARAAVIVTARALVTDVTGPLERGTALSTSATALALAVVFFPTTASYVLNAWGWRSIAVFCVALLGVALVLTVLLEEQIVDRRVRIASPRHRGKGT